MQTEKETLLKRIRELTQVKDDIAKQIEVASKEHNVKEQEINSLRDIIETFERENKELNQEKHMIKQNLQELAEQRNRLSVIKSTTSSKTGLYLIKSHYKEVNNIFTNICRKFTKEKDDFA